MVVTEMMELLNQVVIAVASIALAGIATVSVIVFLHWLWAILTGNIRL